MVARDLPGVMAVADCVHHAFPEDEAVFAERLRLYPGGCLVFSSGEDILGYAISHPWRMYDPPALNSQLGEIPREPDTYYIHDVALMPELHGSGAAALVVALLLARAQKYLFPTVSLVAVSGSAGFWERHGFRNVASQKVVSATLVRKLRAYDDAAIFMARQIRK